MCLQTDLFIKTFSYQLKICLEIFLIKLIHMKITKIFFYLEALFLKIITLHKNVVIFQSLQTCEGNRVKRMLENKLLLFHNNFHNHR